MCAAKLGCQLHLPPGIQRADPPACAQACQASTFQAWRQLCRHGLLPLSTVSQNQAPLQLTVPTTAAPCQTLKPPQRQAARQHAAAVSSHAAVRPHSAGLKQLQGSTTRADATQPPGRRRQPQVTAGSEEYWETVRHEGLVDKARQASAARLQQLQARRQQVRPQEQQLSSAGSGAGKQQQANEPEPSPPQQQQQEATRVFEASAALCCAVFEPSAAPAPACIGSQRALNPKPKIDELSQRPWQAQAARRSCADLTTTAAAGSHLQEAYLSCRAQELTTARSLSGQDEPRHPC